MSDAAPNAAPGPTDAAPGPTDAATCVLTAMGPDHPGILDDVAAHLYGQGGRIVGLQVGRLRGQTTMIAEVRGDGPSLARIRDGLEALAERVGMHIELHEPAAEPADASVRPLRLHAAGDHANGGTALRAVTNLLRVLSVNIADAHVDQAPGLGWRFTLLLDVPRELPEDKLRELVRQLFEEQRATWDLVTV